jgi:folate-binding protein YgfZ
LRVASIDLINKSAPCKPPWESAAMTRRAAFLEDRGIVRVSGEDAAAFLQNLLTNDVEALAPHEARYAALLTPQGKILFDFLVVHAPADAGASYLLDCDRARAADLAKRLSLYKLRAKVAIADESADHGVIAYWHGEPENAPGGVFYRDPRALGLGHRAILPRAMAIAVGEADVGEYEALRISLGVPKGGVDFAFGDAFPHDADMDLLGGVDFKKGCYVGQEVVSRMKHRGEARKRVVRVRLEGAGPAPGVEVTDGERPVGVLGSSSGRHALALLRLDRVEEAKVAERSLVAGGVELVVVEGEDEGRL